MYEIYSGDYCIYNDVFLEKDSKVLTPRWKQKDNSAGSLSFVLPRAHRFYNDVKGLSSVIQLRRYGIIIWEGRVIEDQIDFWNQRHITCEGALAYLNDTTQPPARFQNKTIYAFLEILINNHNSRVGVDKQFKMGSITVHDPNDSIYKYTNNESTWQCISEKLLDVYGGHIQVRYSGGNRYLDYLEDYPRTSTQEIHFGENLLDFTRNFDLTSLATVIMPKGARLEESPVPGLEAYLDVKSVNGGSPYVTSEEAIAKYGWIEKVVEWDDVTIPKNLLRKAQDYLSSVQFENMVIEANAFDLSYLRKNDDPIQLLDEVRCISPPHGMDRIFPVTEIDLPLDDPGGATYTFGESFQVNLAGQLIKDRSKQKIKEQDIYQAISDQGDSLQNEIRGVDDKIVLINTEIKNVEQMIQDTNDYVSESAQETLEQAKENATQMITMAADGLTQDIENAVNNLNQTIRAATTGFITITTNENETNELFITNTKDYTKATKLWRWNINGLGYSKDGGQTYGLAMTMDGAIVADFITTGTMSADRVRTGTLVSANGNTAWNLDTGELAMRTGSINLGDKFTVNNDGYMTATAGKIAGFDISARFISNGHIQVGEDGYYVLNSKKEIITYFGLNYFSEYPNQKYLAIDADDSLYGIGLVIGGQTRAFLTGGKKPSGINPSDTDQLWLHGSLSVQKYVNFNLVSPNGLFINFDNANFISGAVANATMPFVQITNMNSDGTASYWYSNCKLHIVQGVIMASGSTFHST